jgi:hypothetical protein
MFQPLPRSQGVLAHGHVCKPFAHECWLIRHERWPKGSCIRTDRWPTHARVCKPEGYCSQAATAIPPTPEGGRNFCDRAPYFHEHILLYRKVALEALCRFLRFFKYRQVHALLRDPIGEDLDNPTWTDDTGQEVPSGVHLVEASLYGIELDDDVGIHALAAPDDPALQQALADPPIEPELYEELLSDARAALFQGHLRRAVLELAISCEVATRHTLSIKAPSERYKKRGIYLLLDQEAKRVFGECFQDADSEAYMSIDHLFQRRDQIAHQGKGEDIDLAAAKEWFKAADRLFHWLRRMRP